MNIVSFSTGLSSALTVDRVLKNYGREQVEVIFMDTKIEDEDNYRFMDDCMKRWGSATKITVLAEGRTPYEVSRAQHVIPNQKLAPCTFRLKIEVFTDYLKNKYKSEPLIIHIGYDYTEMHRIPATEKNYKSLGWVADFPLLWKPYELRRYSDVVRHDWGIEPPRMYLLGYTHANCGGMCVKQGQGDWIRTLINFPERYKQAEEWEQEMRDHPKRKNYAILRDQTEATVKPLTLKELRERYEASQGQMNLFELDTKSSCVVCGVGG